MMYVGIFLGLSVMLITFTVFQATFKLNYIDSEEIPEILKNIQYFIYSYVMLTTYNRI